MRLLLDLDGVVVDLIKKWARVYNERYEQTLLTCEFSSIWDIGKNPKIVCGEKVYDILHEPGFFEDLEPMPGAIQVIKDLYDVDDIYFVTAFSGDPQDAFGKVTWVKNFMPWFDRHRLIMTNSKFICQGDVLVDDSPKNLKRFLANNPGKCCILFGAAHNENFLDFARVDSWHELRYLLGAVRTMFKKSERVFH